MFFFAVANADLLRGQRQNQLIFVAALKDQLLF
jgi:hypothetical protein